jgi:hypothetical protein
MSKLIDKFKKHQSEQPMVPEFVYTVMSPTETIHHVFLIDMITENYKLVRTLENTTRERALMYAKDLANASSDELHTDSLSLGRVIDAELLKLDKLPESTEPAPTAGDALKEIKKNLPPRKEENTNA